MANLKYISCMVSLAAAVWSGGVANAQNVVSAEVRDSAEPPQVVVPVIGTATGTPFAVTLTTSGPEDKVSGYWFKVHYNSNQVVFDSSTPLQNPGDLDPADHYYTSIGAPQVSTKPGCTHYRIVLGVGDFDVDTPEDRGDLIQLNLRTAAGYTGLVNLYVEDHNYPASTTQSSLTNDQLGDIIYTVDTNGPIVSIPTITGLVKEYSIDSAGEDVNLVINGTNFLPSTEVTFDGQVLTPSSITANQIQVVVPEDWLIQLASMPLQ